MLVLTIVKNEPIHIGEDVVVHLAEIQGGQVRLAFDAPKNVSIDRDKIRKRKLAGLKPDDSRGNK